ncbi:MAG: class B sortase [Aristaeellaceae bacterium]
MERTREAEIRRKRRARARRIARKKMRRCTLISIIAFLIGAVCLGLFIYSNVQERREANLERKLQQMFEGEAVQTSARFSLFGSALAEEAVPAPVETQRPIAQRFTQLYSINSDLVGWIIAGGDTSDAVVFRDNSYYLDHDFYGESSKSGTVFVDMQNDSWEDEPYVLVYGHNMKNGTMFGSMNLYRQIDYFRNSTRVQFYSIYADEPVEFVPFALLDVSMNKSDESYFALRQYALFDLPEGSERDAQVQALIDEICERSLYAIPGLDVTPQDKILGLVTCSYDMDNARLVLYCRALREGETPEQMAQLVQMNIVEK